MHISRSMTGQHLIALLICINQLMAGPGRKKAPEEKSEDSQDTIKGRSRSRIANDSPHHALDINALAALVQLAALAFRSAAIFMLLLVGNIAVDSLALAHKVFAVVQPPHLNWIHHLVPDFLDSALSYSGRLHTALL